MRSERADQEEMDLKVQSVRKEEQAEYKTEARVLKALDLSGRSHAPSGLPFVCRLTLWGGGTQGRVLWGQPASV